MQIVKNKNTEELIPTLQKKLVELTFENRTLKDELAWFRRQVFGSKSERYTSNDEQCALDFGSITNDAKPIEDTQTVVYERSQSTNQEKSSHGKSSLPSHLPRKRKVIPADFDTTGYKKIREQITETLQYTPPTFWVLQEVRGVYIKKENGNSDIRLPKLPSRLIDQGTVGTSVIAQLIVDKCTFHQPLYRLTQQWEAATGMYIPNSNVYEWFAKGCFWLDAIRHLMLEKIKHSGYVQLDESSIRVQVKKTKKKCHLGNMLVVHSPVDKLVVFTYRESKNKDGPEEVLGKIFQGCLQTDGAPAYNSFASQKGVSHAGCNAHARRYFEEALGSDKARAETMLDYYQQLFKIESIAHEQSLTPLQRLELRKKQARPIVEKMKIWLDNQVKENIPKGKIGKAVTYALNHWNHLTVFMENGSIELSNNWIENVIRLLAMGRKNFLFAGSEDGARNLATAYSIMATCRLNNINPYDYTNAVLNELPNRDSNQIEDLLPTNWAAAQKKDT